MMIGVPFVGKHYRNVNVPMPMLTRRMAIMINQAAKVNGMRLMHGSLKRWGPEKTEGE